MVDVFEAFGFELVEGFGAAATNGAVDEVRLILVQFVDLFAEGFVVEIDVHCFGEVTVFEFLAGTDVEDDDVGLGLQQFGSSGGVHVFGAGNGGFGGGGGGEAQTEDERGDEEAEGEENGFHGVNYSDGWTVMSGN